MSDEATISRSGAETEFAAEDEDSGPLLAFHRLVPGARLPMRADRAALGSLPTRAFRYCEAIVSAAAFGWYIFPPTGFSLLWDGRDISFTCDGADGWTPLKSAQVPGFVEHFDKAAPDDVKGFAMPFISALQEPGLVQLWSGLVARTAPGWSLLLRAPANLPAAGGYELYEGIVETDRWFGPLFGAVRLTKTNVPISFAPDYPLFQAQLIPREVHGEATLDRYELVPDIGQLSDDDWADYHDSVVKPNTATKRPKGQYAATSRRRRRQE